MKLKLLCAAALGVTFAPDVVDAQGQTPAPAYSGAGVSPPAPPNPPAAAGNRRQPSLHVRCDGNPDNVTAGETAARLIGAVTLLGLFAPPPEASDESARLHGAEGVAICAQALEGESNDLRRAQLILASAIHHIEAGANDASIAELARLNSDRPALAEGRAFQLSLRLYAMEVEALAHVAAGRVEAGRTRALEMAAAAPYDLITHLRAARFVRLGAQYGPNEELFFQNLVRLYPAALAERALARQMAGDFAGAAADFDSWLQMERSVTEREGMASLSTAALAHALAGNAPRAGELATQAREAITREPTAPAVAAASERLDLYNILAAARGGRAAEARILFAGRSNWVIPGPGAVAEVARRLRADTSAGAPTGPLAADPSHFITSALDQRRIELVERKDRFAAIRLFYPQSAYDRFGANMWRTGRSNYFSREDDERLRARFVDVERNGDGTPAGYAVLLHAALGAQSQGKTHFMLLPGQAAIYAGYVRFGNAGDEGLIAPLAYDARQVLADLAPLIPRPANRSR